MFNNKPEGWVGNSFRPEPEAKPKKLTLYVTVPKFCADEILIEGMTPENYGCLEPLSFIICRSDKPQVITGHAAYFEFEVDEDDPNLRQVNPTQYEYESIVPVSKLTAMAWPPTANWEVLTHLELFNGDPYDPRFKSLWKFHPLRSKGEIWE